MPGNGNLTNQIDKELRNPSATETTAAETNESDCDHWSMQEKFVPHVASSKSNMTSDQRAMVDQTDCFAWLWHDDQDGSECVETSCSLRSHCKQAWQRAQVGAAQNTEYTEAHRRGIGSRSRTRLLKKASPIRGKYKGSEKYNRNGYISTDRPVDALVKSFLLGLGPHENLSGSWTPSSDHLAELSVKATKSYHAVITRGVVIARLWTDTLRSAKVDIAPELVSPVAALASGARFDVPKKIPASCWFKVRPCTHRVKVDVPNEARQLGAIILKKFRFM